MAPARLSARGIHKRFPGVVALDGVDLEVRAGEVLAVVGENGAGKSTLMRILAGVEAPDAGRVLVDGRPVAPGSVRAALAAGAALIHQELVLAENLDVASNVFLGREPRRGPWLDRARLHALAAEVTRRVGLDVDTRTRVETLPLGRRQLVEIARALAADARVIVMDEPTSSLSLAETARLFEVVRALTARGVAVIYISHRLSEVRELADRVLVLRDGRPAGELARGEITHDALVRLMVGRDVASWLRRVPHPPGEVVLDVASLVTDAHPAEALSFAVRAGEIVGLAGLVGAGRSELLETLFGVRRARSGTVLVRGRAVAPGSPRGAVEAGLALVPEDRKLAGLLLDASVRCNLSLPRLRRDARAGAFVDRAAERALARRQIEALGIRAADDLVAAGTLSGGNQQKIVLGKWLATLPSVLLLDEPTRGIDVGAKQEIYELVDALAARGLAVLFASSELEEVLGLSDRVLVLHEGRLAGELSGDALGEEAIMRLATGAGVRRMKKIVGIALLLLVVCVATALASPAFLTAYNVENLLRRSALFGILGIGAAFVILTRGIDLSIGSVVCLVGCLVPWLLDRGWSVPVVLLAMLLLSAAIGVFHGLLVTKLKLQPFVVTLCGLLLYRGIARGITADQSQGFHGTQAALRALGNGRIPLPGVEGFALPAPLVTLVVVALLAAALLHLTVWGRWLLAIGRNETAVRYSGIDVDRWTLLAYVVCALLSGLGGLLFVLDVGSAQPVDFGSFYELYAIAAAVLGGCSLRGGEASVLGVILGGAVMQVLRNSITLVEAIPDNVEYAVIGGVLLLGAAGDELVRRAAAARRRRREARG